MGPGGTSLVFLFPNQMMKERKSNISPQAEGHSLELLLTLGLGGKAQSGQLGMEEGRKLGLIAFSIFLVAKSFGRK